MGARSAAGKGVGIINGILVGSGVSDLAPPFLSLFPDSKICAICSSAAVESSNSLSTPLSVRLNQLKNNNFRVCLSANL